MILLYSVATGFKTKVSSLSLKVNMTRLNPSRGSAVCVGLFSGRGVASWGTLSAAVVALTAVVASRAAAALSDASAPAVLGISLLALVAEPDVLAATVSSF